MTELLPRACASCSTGPTTPTVTSLNPDGGPQSTVVWVRTDGDDVLFSTVKGRRKPRNFERDPRASLLVIDPDEPLQLRRGARPGDHSGRPGGRRSFRSCHASTPVSPGRTSRR